MNGILNLFISITYVDVTNVLQDKTLRERPFNLKGGLWFFSKKIFPMLLKKIF